MQRQPLLTNSGGIPRSLPAPRTFSGVSTADGLGGFGWVALPSRVSVSSSANWVDGNGVYLTGSLARLKVFLDFESKSLLLCTSTKNPKMLLTNGNSNSNPDVREILSYFCFWARLFLKPAQAGLELTQARRTPEKLRQHMCHQTWLFTIRFLICSFSIQFLPLFFFPQNSREGMDICPIH